MNKICSGCLLPILRRYYVMYNENNETEYLCPKCKKIWDKHSPYAKKERNKK